MLLLLVRGTVVLCGTGRAIQYCTVTVTARSHHDHAGSRRSRKMEKKRSIGGQIANRVATDEDALLETDRRAHLIVQGAPPLAMRPPACLPANVNVNVVNGQSWLSRLELKRLLWNTPQYCLIKESRCQDHAQINPLVTTK